MALKYDFTEGTALVRYLGGLSGDAVVTDAKTKYKNIYG